MRNRGPAQIPKRIDSIKFSLMKKNLKKKLLNLEKMNFIIKILLMRKVPPKMVFTLYLIKL